MYFGLYESTVTLKNQLTFPSKLRELSGGELFIAPWFEQSLVVLPKNKAEEVLDRLLQGSISLLPEVRDLESILYVNAQIVNLDKRNRFVLGKNLREYMKVGRNAVFLGIKERIEIWDKDVYMNYSKIREKQIRETAINLYQRITEKQTG